MRSRSTGACFDDLVSDDDAACRICGERKKAYYIFMSLHDVFSEPFGRVKKQHEFINTQQILFNSSGCKFEFRYRKMSGEESWGAHFSDNTTLSNEGQISL